MKHWQKISKIILSLALLSGLLGPVPFIIHSAQTNTHPQLGQIAMEDPDQLVSVIVQMKEGESNQQALVSQLGGVFVSDLPIISAFTAQLSAEAALELSSEPGVRWISLDAPVEKAKRKTTPGCSSGEGQTQNYRSRSRIYNPRTKLFPRHIRCAPLMANGPARSGYWRSRD
jgi:hypothetical protein